MPRPIPSILPDGDIDSSAKAAYGQGPISLRIGNGGAGATGLIEALAYDYMATSADPQTITWVCNHSRNTQLALDRDYIDLALTYEREQEDLAQSEGWSVNSGTVFHDHFILAGPSSDPAGLRSATSLLDAFRKLHQAGALFHSRVDGSATMWKEQSLWSQCNLNPWANEATAGWYKSSRASPAEALIAADAAGAYLLTDRSTLLAQTGQRSISNTTVFFEPTSGDDILMNSCNALYSPFTTSPRAKTVQNFILYMLSPRGQRVIESYGKEQCGLALFTSLREGYATTPLVGGVPRNGRWTLRSKL